MKYDVIAYCWNDALAGFTQEDARRLTHVNLAFGLIKDGLLDLHLLKYLHLLPKLREWNPEMKIVLSVGGWGADGFSDMAMTEEGRRNFAKSCLDAVEKYDLDGIDIDWEYPCSDAAGIGADPRDKENFTALLATLREYLGKGRIVSVAVGASQRCIADTQMDKVAEIVDYVQLMTYDMVDGTRAGHHAALGATKGRQRMVVGVVVHEVCGVTENEVEQAHCDDEADQQNDTGRTYAANRILCRF